VRKLVGEASGALTKDLVGKVAETAIARTAGFLTGLLTDNAKAASEAILPPAG
jgi:hypothetical protein